MTAISLRASAAAVLLVLPLAAGAAPADPPAVAAAPAAVQPPKAMTAIQSALRELSAAIDQGPHLGRNLERLKDFQHRPATAQALRETLGSERPWTVDKQGAGYRLAFLPVRQQLESGATIAWTEFPIDMTVDASGKRLGYEGAWAELSYEDEALRAAMRDLRLRGDQRLGAGRLWYGDVGIQVAEVSMESKKEGEDFVMRMKELDFSSHTKERGAVVDISQKFGAKSVSVAGEEVTGLAMDYRIVNIDKKTLMTLAESERRLAAAGKDEASLGDFKRMLRQFGRAAAAQGTKLVFDRIAASYGGHTATVRGSLGLKKGPASDFDDLKKVLRRADARFEVAVPVALVKAVMTTVARRQAAARGAGAPGQDADALSQTLTDVVIGKLVGGGFARLDGDVLRATIEIKDGVIRINGKKVDLPTPPKPQQPGGPAPSMPARQISGSCTMPDFPREVVEKDGTLTLTLGAVVSEQGVPGEITVLEPSGYPDYDREAVAAMAGCRYIPALNDNAPVAQPVKLTLKREPGAVRP